MGIKDILEKYKKRKTYELAAEREASRREKAAYYKAKAHEAELFGKQKAKFEREHRLKNLKASYAKPSSGTFGGIDLGGMSGGIDAWAGMGGSAPKTKVRYIKVKSYKKSKSKRRPKTRRVVTRRVVYREHREPEHDYWNIGM